jgi:hypothetical protein
LQRSAKPKTLVISPETYRLVGGLFAYRDSSLQSLKGFGKPTHLYQVLGAEYRQIARALPHRAQRRDRSTARRPRHCLPPATPSATACYRPNEDSRIERERLDRHGYARQYLAHLERGVDPKLGGLA